MLPARPRCGDAGPSARGRRQITVWQREELSGEFTVAPDGSLNHPLYREMRVTGMPVSQVEERVRSFLSAYEANPQLVVQPQYKVSGRRAGHAGPTSTTCLPERRSVS